MLSMAHGETEPRELDGEWGAIPWSTKALLSLIHLLLSLAALTIHRLLDNGGAAQNPRVQSSKDGNLKGVLYTTCTHMLVGPPDLPPGMASLLRAQESRSGAPAQPPAEPLLVA